MAMNYEYEQPSNALAGSVACSRAVVPLTVERIQEWLHRPAQTAFREMSVRLEERRRERARIAREFHDTVLQGFLGASMVLESAVSELPADSPSRPSLNRALSLMRRVIEEGRDALHGLRSTRTPAISLEQSLAELGDELKISGVGFRVSVVGRTKTIDATIQEQVYLIGREAVLNALRHSKGTNIEAEVEYLPERLRLVVRDDGCGIDEGILLSGRVSHWGLQGMRERATGFGGQLRIWSRKGAGSEVELRAPYELSAKVQA
jgi:signal transduction histidine kinase